MRSNLHLASVSFLGGVLVFGGTYSKPEDMYKFSEEGELVADLSGLPLIPKYMCLRSFVVHKGKIFAEGNFSYLEGWTRVVSVFDGEKWSEL